MRKMDKTTQLIARGLLWMMLVFAGCSQALPHVDTNLPAAAASQHSFIELSVEPKWIRVELEIGLEDLAAFRHIVPDNVYERLRQKNTPLAKRLQQFFFQDFVLQADGNVLSGKLSSIEVRLKKPRDPISGRVLRHAKAGKQEVLRAILIYPFQQPFTRLTMRPPPSPVHDIGLVVYHNGIPINDLSALSQSESVILDWDDPWFSEFEDARFARQFNVPVLAQLMIEPSDVRKEILVRLADLQEDGVAFGFTTDVRLNERDKTLIKERVAHFFQKRNPVMINGIDATPRITQVRFVRRTSEGSEVVAPSESIPFAEAIVSVVTQYPVLSSVHSAAMQWQFFGQNTARVYGRIIDPEQERTQLLRQEDGTLIWKQRQQHS